MHCNELDSHLTPFPRYGKLLVQSSLSTGGVRL